MKNHLTQNIHSNRLLWNFLVSALSLFLIMGAIVIASDPNELANERIPVKAQKLEAHWKINCNESLKTAMEILGENAHLDKNDTQITDALKKCAYIYNTPGATHYKTTPDFNNFVEQINKVSR